jgi:hypothetical protein
MAATAYAFPEPSETRMDPGDADLARRLLAALHRRGLDVSESDAVAIARELQGVDLY